MLFVPLNLQFPSTLSIFIFCNFPRLTVRPDDLLPECAEKPLQTWRLLECLWVLLFQILLHIITVMCNSRGELQLQDSLSVSLKFSLFSNIKLNIFKQHFSLLSPFREQSDERRRRRRRPKPTAAPRSSPCVFLYLHPLLIPDRECLKWSDQRLHV